MLLEKVDSAIEALRSVVAEFDVSSLTGELAARLAERFSNGEKVCASAAALCAGRVEETRYHEQLGNRDAARWLAGLRGTSQRAAEEALGVARSLGELPELEEALRAGELSEDQARLISSAATLEPEAADDLVQTARSGSMKELRDHAEQVKAAARSKEEQEARHRRVHEARHLRTWSRDGAFEGRFSLTPENGAKLMGAVEHLAAEAAEQSVRQGSLDPYEAYLADGLVALATGEGASQPPRDTEAGSDGLPLESLPSTGSESPLRRRRCWRPDYTIFVRVDLEALARGHLESGEECSIDGAGHVSVATVQSLLDTAKVRLIVTDGVEISSIYSCKRNVAVALDTALRFRDRTCVVPGCGATFHLERDHIREFSKNGPTALSNMCLLCSVHHRMKTTKGYRISGGPGRWRWLRPDGTPASAREQSAADPPSLHRRD